MYRSTSPILIMLLLRSFQCGVGNSNIIEKDMMPGKSLLGSYEVVKAAFERCYDKLGISCQDVGGLIDYRKKQYKKGAEACGGVMPGMSNRPLISLCFSGRFNLCILGQGVFDSNFVGGFPTLPESQKSQPYQPAASSSGNAQPTSSGGLNVALIVGLSSVCTLFFVLMVVALNKRKPSGSHKSPPVVMFDSSDSNPNGGEPAKALDENGIV